MLVITLGIVLLVVSLLTGVIVLKSIGVLLIIVGLVLVLLGSSGRAVGGRRHYW